MPDPTPEPTTPEQRPSLADYVVIQREELDAFHARIARLEDELAEARADRNCYRADLERSNRLVEATDFRLSKYMFAVFNLSLIVGAVFIKLVYSLVMKGGLS